MQVDVICCHRVTLNQAQVTFGTNRATRPLISTLILLAKKLLKLPPTGLHKFWNPAIPAWRTWSKLGEHGKHRKYGRYGRHQLDYLKHSIYGSKHSIYVLQHFICQRDDSIHCFMAFLARVKNHNMRLENMILRQLKIGERQASCCLLLSQTFPLQTISFWNFHHQPPPLVASDQSIGLFLHLGNSCTAAATTAGLEPAAFYWKILITLNISSICRCKN